MLNSVNFQQTPEQVRLFLCLPDQTTIAELQSAYRRTHTKHYGGIDQLVFSLPYRVKADMKFVRNPDVDLINGDYLIRLEQNGDPTYFVISKYHNTLSDGKQAMEVECQSLPYELRNKIVPIYAEQKMLYDFIGTNSVLHDTLLRLTEWTVDYCDAQAAVKQRQFDVSQMTMLDFLFQVAETYNVIPVFDTIQRRVSFYREEDYGSDKGLVIDERYLKSIEEQENHEDIVTRLYGYGKERLSFAAVNPTGAEYIEDFSYYMYPFEQDDEGNVLRHSQFMSDSLCRALLAYRETVESHRNSLHNLLVARAGLVEQQGPLNVQLFSLTADLDTINANINVNIRSNLDLTVLNAQKVVKLDALKAKQREIDEATADIGSVTIDITITHAATAAGTIRLHIGSELPIEATVSAGDSVAVVAGKLYAAVAALYPTYANERYVLLRPTFTATISGAVVAITYFTAAEANDCPVLFTDAAATGVAVTSTVSDRGVDNQMAAIKRQLAVPNNFTAEQIVERNRFIKEKVWSDSKYIDAQDLYEEGIRRLASVSQPILTYSISSVDFLSAINTPHDWDRLPIGSVVTVQYAPFGINAKVKAKQKRNQTPAKQLKAKVITIEHDLDGYEITLTIANYKQIKSGFLKFGDLVKSIASTSATVDFNKDVWGLAKEANDAVSQVLNREWDAAKRAVTGDADNSVVIDKRGITLTDPQTVNNILRMTNGVIAMSSDGGNSFKTGITGRGIVAEKLFGTLTASTQLTITNAAGNFTVDSDGVVIQDMSLSITRSGNKSRILLDPLNGLRLQANTGTVSPIWTDRLAADSEGNLLMTGHFQTGSGASLFKVDGDGLYMGGSTPATAKFKVNLSGDAVANSITLTDPDITVGSNGSVLKIDKTNGIWLGSNSFATAPFSVSLAGAVTATNLKISTTQVNGLGSLATKSAVNWSADISGSGKPADNADRTETTINNGLVTTGRLEVGTGAYGSVNAGINGSGTASTSVRFWAGNTFASSSTAPFRVLQDGRLFASQATISGEINATSGKFTGSILSEATITGGTFVGGTIKTASSGKRMQLDTNGIRSFNEFEELNGLVISSGNFTNIDFYYRGTNRGGISQAANAVFLTTKGTPTSGADLIIRAESSNAYGAIEITPGTAASVKANGRWEFTGSVSGITAMFA
ncbi:phage tail protein [Paenibacillus cymbidii]|uniref:phage tail protein n=1 Tax=Paenibacillus cymbidii TaxID=1639034 RepID=UPI001080A48A|nr:phage tail protein [Paenibacillus cymbidii]